MSFSLTGYATLTHLAPRKEGPGDDKVLALDAKLEMSVGYEIAAALAGADIAEALFTSLWDVVDVDLNPRFLGLGKIECPDAEFGGLTAVIGGIKIEGAKARKFSFKAAPKGSADLAFSLSVSNPPSNALPVLAEYLGEALHLVITTAQMDLDLSGEAA